MREAAEQARLDALAVQGRPQRADVRLQSIQNELGVLGGADVEKGLHNVVCEGVVQQ